MSFDFTMDDRLSYRWLGAQGVELSCGGQVLAIDPFFTRPPAQVVLFGRMRPNSSLIQRLRQRCDYILVTHPHYDHVLDVPFLARDCGAVVYGSANTGRLLEVSGVPGEQFQEIQANRHLSLGPFEVDVFTSQHMGFPLDALLQGSLEAGLKPPLRLFDYRMDQVFGFFIRAQEVRILFHPGPALPADVLFAGLSGDREYYLRLLTLARPKVFVPLHWDNFFRPLDQPLRELEAPGRMSLKKLESLVAQTAPGTKFSVPELLVPSALDF